MAGLQCGMQQQCCGEWRASAWDYSWQAQSGALAQPAGARNLQPQMWETVQPLRLA